jgi:hypothetical protein
MVSGPVVDAPAVGHGDLAALRTELRKSVTGFTLYASFSPSLPIPD